MSKAAGRPQTRYVCQSCGESFLRWEGQCRACQAWNSLVETAVRPEPRSGPPIAAASGIGGAVETRRLVDVGRGRAASASASASPSSTASSAAGSSPAPSSSSAASRGSASRRSSSRPRPASPRPSAPSACSTPPARSPRPRSGSGRTARAARRPGGRDPDRRRVSIDRIADVAIDEPSPALLVVDSIQTATGRRARRAGRQRRPGPGRGAPPDGGREAERDRGRPRRPRDEGRLDRRAEDARAPRRRGPDARRRAIRRRPPPARRRRTASARPTRSACSRWARRASARSPIRPGRSSPSTTGRRRAAWSRRRSRARRPLLVEVQALVAPGPGGTPRRTTSGVDANRVALLVAVLGRRAGIGLGSHDVYVNLAGGLDRRRARPRPAARDRPRLVAPRSSGRVGHRRDRRGRPARRAARGDAAWSGGCARRRGSGSAGRSSRAARAVPPHRASTGLEIVAVGEPPGRDRRGAERRSGAVRTRGVGSGRC